MHLLDSSQTFVHLLDTSKFRNTLTGFRKKENLEIFSIRPVAARSHKQHSPELVQKTLNFPFYESNCPFPSCLLLVWHQNYLINLKTPSTNATAEEINEKEMASKMTLTKYKLSERR